MKLTPLQKRAAHKQRNTQQLDLNLTALVDVFTIPSDLSGTPAISIPCGLSDGLPVGFQIMGPLLGEPVVLSAAFAIEQAIGFDARPALAGRSA